MASKPIVVRWLDHFDIPATWDEPTPPEDLKPAEVESVGYLVSESDTCIQLAGDRPLDEDDNEHGRMCVILKCAITYRSDKP